MAGTRHCRGGHPKESTSKREWSGELTPVTRGGCNHVSAVPCFLDWTVGPVPSRWSPLSSLSFSLTRVQTRVHTRKPRSVGPPVYSSFRVRCAHPRSLSLSPSSLSLFSSFSRYPAGSRRAQMRLSRQRARSGHRTSFLFLRRGSLILRSPDISSFCRSLRRCDSFASLLIAFLARAASSFLLLVLCTIKFSLFRIMEFIHKGEKTETHCLTYHISGIIQREKTN